METLPKDALVGVLTRVSEPSTLMNASEVCKHWRNTAKMSIVWEALARKLYPPQTLDIGLYGTWSNLVLDENRLGAMHTINPGRECIWQWNRPGQFYLCKIDGLKWDRSQRKLRVYIDARGQHDLRLPITSSLSLSVVGGTEGSWMFCSLPPDSFHPEVEAPGHFRGYLTWDVESLEQFIPNDAEPCAEATLKFCYANSPKSPNGGHRPDYSIECVAKATDLSQGLLPGIFKGCPYDGPSSIYEGETEEAEMARWSNGIPQEVLQFPGWWV